MSDFGALYEYIVALEEEVPEAALAKVRDRRPSVLPETKAMREEREKEEREAKTKEEREAAAAKTNGQPKPPPHTPPAPPRQAA